MEVGERYIIEISDVITTNNGNIAKIKGFNALVFDERGLKKLSKVEVDPRFLTQRGISESLSKERQYGYNNGYDKGFKDGVKYQESVMPPKAKTHEPQVGDIYKKKSDGSKVIITYNDMGMYKVLLPDGDDSYYDVKELNKYYDFVENRADLLEPIKGVLA